MTVTRRAFTFASLAAAFGRVARAETPAQDQAPRPIPELEEASGYPSPRSPRPGSPDLQPGARLVPVERGQVELTLEVKNRGAAATMLVARGSRPAGDPVVTMRRDGAEVALVAVQTEVDRREMMSRMGPMPRYADLKSGETLALGPFRFEVPAGASGPATVRFSLLTGKELGADGFKAQSFVVEGVGLGDAAS